MRNRSPFVPYIEPGSPASIRVVLGPDYRKTRYQIYLDERQNDFQVSFLYRKGMTPPEPIPDEFRSYAILLDRPVLMLKVLTVEAKDTWLMFDWCSEQRLATKVVLAHANDPDCSIQSEQLRRSAENAIAIYRTFCQAC